MEGLKLNQKILADSTCYFSSGQIVELCPTTLKDARNTTNGIRIDLGGGHNWGACPTRERSRVIAQVDDLKKFFETKLSRKEGIEERVNSGKSLLRVYHNQNNQVLYVVEFRKGQEVDSLREGKYVVYEENSFFKEYIKVYNNNIPLGFYSTIEEAFKALENKVKVSLR